MAAASAKLTSISCSIRGRRRLGTGSVFQGTVPGDHCASAEGTSHQPACTWQGWKERRKERGRGAARPWRQPPP